MNEQLIDVQGLALIPGPAEIEPPLYSFEVYDELVCHLPEEVAGALLAIEGLHQTGDANPASGHWTARWQSEDRFLDLNLTLMEPDEGHLVWGGSELRGRYTKSDLLGIWLALCDRFEGVWLHDTDCRMWTPETFNDWQPGQ